jgi:CheY-like chemotaxis protein
MPEMNGYSATKLIRKAEQEKQNHSEALQAQVPENSSSTLHPTERPSHRLPIIAMTAKHHEGGSGILPESRLRRFFGQARPAERR